MPAMVGTASLDWVLRILGIEVSAVEGLLGTSPPGANGVNVLPYLATSGERAPFVDPLAAGSISGMRLTTNRDDIVRAVCEGLAYTARHCFESAGQQRADRRDRRRQQVVELDAGVRRRARGPRWCSPALPRWERAVRCWPEPRPAARSSTWRSGPAPRVWWSPTTRTARSTTPASQHQMELLEAARPLWHTRAALATQGDKK